MEIYYVRIVENQEKIIKADTRTMRLRVYEEKSIALTRRVIVEKYVLKACELDLFGRKTIFWKSVYEGALECDEDSQE